LEPGTTSKGPPPRLSITDSHYKFNFTNENDKELFVSNMLLAERVNIILQME
jgi:hypothetical protein